MSTLNDVRQHLNQTWHNMTEGWHQLYHRASQALTRFKPLATDKPSSRTMPWQQNSHWGLLASDVEESADHITVRLEVPGMEKNDFDISVYDDALLVKGSKHYQHQEEQGRIHVHECAYGHFERVIPLPTAVDDQAAKAKYRRGVLTIQLAKKKVPATGRIPIQTN